MSAREKRPRGLVVYDAALTSLSLLDDAQAGRVIKSLASYFIEGAEPVDLTQAECIVFALLRRDCDAALDEYGVRCARNRKNAASRCESLPVATSGSESEPVGRNRTEWNKTEKIETEFKCSACGAKISQGVADFSFARFGKVLCLSCQPSSPAKTTGKPGHRVQEHMGEINDLQRAAVARLMQGELDLESKT